MIVGKRVRDGWRNGAGDAVKQGLNFQNAKGCRAAALTLAFACAAFSAAAEDFELTGAIGLDSRGSYRGTLGDGFRPASHGYLELVRGEFLAGVFANPVKIQGENGALVLSYASWKPSVGKIDLEVGARRYWFPGSSDFIYDFDRDGLADHAGRKGLFEAQAGVRRKFNGGRVHLRAFYTPDGFGETGPAWYFNGEGRVNIAYGFEARGAVGVSRFSDPLYNEDYVDYRAGLYKTALGFDMYVRYSDTAGLSGPDNSAVIFGVERDFTLASSARGKRRRFEKIRNDWIVDKSLIGFGAIAGPQSYWPAGQ